LMLLPLGDHALHAVHQPPAHLLPGGGPHASVARLPDEPLCPLVRLASGEELPPELLHACKLPLPGTFQPLDLPLGLALVPGLDLGQVGLERRAPGLARHHRPWAPLLRSPSRPLARRVELAPDTLHPPLERLRARAHLLGAELQPLACRA